MTYFAPNNLMGSSPTPTETLASLLTHISIDDKRREQTWLLGYLQTSLHSEHIHDRSDSWYRTIHKCPIITMQM
jgi:hypothetical protein